MLRKSGRVIVWSPPRVMTRGRVLPCKAGPVSLALVAGARDRIELWPSSICCNAYALSYLALDQYLMLFCSVRDDLRCNGNVSTINHCRPITERVGFQGNIISSTTRERHQQPSTS